MRWKIGVGTALLALVGLPLMMPFLDLIIQPGAWLAWTEASRLASVCQNTFWLVLGALAITVPAGILLAGLLYRSDLPGKDWWRGSLFLTLLIPLPLFASAWQSVLGTGGLLPFPLWNQRSLPSVAETNLVWTPWGQGIGSAIWIHGLAGLPWFILLVGLGLRSVEGNLEEDARTFMGPLPVFFRVSLRRSIIFVIIAAVLVSLQIITEITITDLMQVRTYAEEVYTQMVAPDPATAGVSGETRALAIAVPFSVLVTCLLIGLGKRTASVDFQGLFSTNPTPILKLGNWRYPCLLGVSLFTIFYLGLPLLSLIWRTGNPRGGPGWSAAIFGRHMGRVCLGEGRFLIQCLLGAGIAGILTSSLALVACWGARTSKTLRFGLLILSALCWAWPGPVTGLGLKSLLQWIVEQSNSSILAMLLWHGPSQIPIIWVDLIRFFPVAVVMLWPSIRRIPQEILDGANLDGIKPGQELLGIIFPLLKTPFLMAGLMVAVLSLGELSASKIVSTPASPSYAGELFAQMHYGISNDLTARCLVLLMVIATGGIVLLSLKRTA